MHRLVRATAALVVGLIASAPASAAAQDRPRVLVTTVDDSITPVVADHLAEGISHANAEGYDAYVIRLDTPGGLDTSMRRIVQRILASEVPVVVYVSPQGARAASAGAVIALAAHVAAMAPGTAIGASTPVSLEGEDLERKVVNDAVAYTESLARLRGRDIGFARDMVLEGRSIPAEEAVRIHAVDFMASSLDDVLRQAEGLAGAEVVERDMTLFRRIQQRLSDPNLTFLFLSLGTLALMYELAAPGLTGPGVTGIVLLLLAFFGLAVLPVNVVGLLFLAAAAALFAAELFAPGTGVAAVGGTLALALAGVFLFDDASGLDVSLGVIAPLVVLVGGGVVFAGRLAVRSRKTVSTLTGPGLLLGREVTVGRLTDTGGQVFVEGAWWRVRTAGAPLEVDQAVRVVDVDGLELVVEPVGLQEENQP